jgi:hypothetical protein
MKRDSGLTYLSVKVPLDREHLADPILQELEDGRTAGTVDLDLVHKHGVWANKTPRSDKSRDVFVLGELLPTKLGRGERLNDQLRVTLEQLSKLFVMLSRQASLACDVTDEHHLPAERSKVHRLLLDVERGQFVERAAGRRRSAETTTGSGRVSDLMRGSLGFYRCFCTESPDRSESMVTSSRSTCAEVPGREREETTAIM